MQNFYLLVLMAFVLIKSPLAAQKLAKDNRLDSLTISLEQARTDTARAAVMQSLSDYWLSKDSAKSMSYVQSSLEIYQQNHDDIGTGMGYYYKGNIYLEYNQLDSADQLYQKAEKLLKNDSSRQGYLHRAKLWYNIGALQQRRGNDDKFLEILLNKSVPLLEEVHDTLTIAINYHSVGIVLMNNLEYQKAIHYYDLAIATLNDYPKYNNLIKSHLYKGRTYLFWNKYDQADSSFAKAEQLLHKSEESEVSVLFYTFKGMSHYFRDEYEKALPYYDEGIKIANRLHEKYLIQELLLGKYYALNDLERFSEAKLVLEDLYSRSKEFSLLKNQIVLLNNLVEIEEKTGNIHGAYQWLQEYVTLSDSLNKRESALKVKELEAKFQAEKSQNEILELTNQNQLQEIQLQKSKYWLVFSAVVLGLLAIIFAIAFLLIRKRQQLSTQKAQLLEQKVSKMNQEHQLKIFSAMLEGQEQERKRLAIDLHDGLGGSLSGIKLKLSTWLQDKPQYLKNNGISPIIDQLDNSVNELRRIARNMMPETLLKYGLKTALRDYCEGLENDQYKIILQIYGLKDNIPQASQIMIYRIVQELITNAIKHAQPHEILVQILQDRDNISITVEDDGLGFDIKSKKTHAGLGLSTVKTRVEYLKGNMEIHSQADVGTSICVEIDLNHGK